MIELIHTSVPHGLLPCTNGYTTAVMTRNVHDRLRQQLEELSGFSFVETAYGKHDENPVAWNHAILRQGEHVLSRIAAAPSDYTGRTNYLARLFYFPAAEFSSEGGAAMLLKNSDLLSERWDGEVKSLDPDPEKAASFQPPERASLAPQTWKEIFGEDKGGSLAASFATALQALLCTGGRSLYFVTSHTWDPTGKTLLTLFDELIALLPSNLRKKVTFSTYSTGSSISGQFHLRGILKGSEEFASIEQQQRPWVDFPERKVFHEDRLPPCDTKILDAARTGKRADDTPPKPSATVATPPTEENAEAVRQAEARRQEAVRREAEEKEASLRQAQAEIRHLEELRLQEELRRHDAERSEATAKKVLRQTVARLQAEVKRHQQNASELIEANKTIKTRTLIVIIVAISVFILSIVLCVHFRVGSMTAEQACNEAVCEKNAEDPVKKLTSNAEGENKKTDAAPKKEKENSEKLKNTPENEKESLRKNERDTFFTSCSEVLQKLKEQMNQNPPSGNSAQGDVPNPQPDSTGKASSQSSSRTAQGK